MDRIITIIKRELSVFQQLSRESKLLLPCMTLFWFASPFIGLFLNIYLWREVDSLGPVALFNLFIFLGLPLGFITNGFLLKKKSLVSALRLGILAQGIFPLLIILLRENAFRFLAPLGLINGLSGAFYWANLNLLIYDLTSDKIRGYYTGLQEVLGSAIGIITPPLVGFVIVIFGQEWLRLSLRNSYYLSFSIAAFFFLLSALIAGKMMVVKERLEFSLKDVSFKNLSKNWLSIRIMSVASGFPNGIFILTWSLLAFEFFGRELEVGWFNGFLGVVGVMAAYFAGRYAKPEKRMRATVIGTIFYFTGAMFFGINFSLPAFYLLGVLVGIGDLFIWTVEFPILMREMERGYLPESQRYSYWVDREIFVNIGRLLGMATFVLFTGFFAFQFVYRTMFIIIAFVSLILLLTIRNLIKVE